MYITLLRYHDTGTSKNYLLQTILTHWGRVVHICVSKLTIIGSDISLSPGQHQTISWTNVGILLIWPRGTNLQNVSLLVPASMCLAASIGYNLIEVNHCCTGHVLGNLNFYLCLLDTEMAKAVWSSSSWKTKDGLFYIVNTRTVGFVVTQGAMVLI